MNYAQARKLSNGSGWHFTVQNDDRIWTHSCCREQVPATQEDVDRSAWMQMDWPKLGQLIDGPPHAPHNTREEAEECYRAWCLRKVEETLEFTEKLSSQWHGCEFDGCDTPTKGGARYNADHWPEQVALCDAHRTKEAVLSQVRIGTSSAYS